MKNICNYMIIQRDSDGFGRASYRVNHKLKENEIVVARVVNEETGVTAVPWQLCEPDDDEVKTELIIPQGGLYRVEARLANGEFDAENNSYDWCGYIDYAQHIGVGDIFIMAGQSNMSGYGKDPAMIRRSLESACLTTAVTGFSLLILWALPSIPFIRITTAHPALLLLCHLPK